MNAIILAGGEGTRLRPLTYTIPKPLIPVGDKTLTDCVFDILRCCGVSRVYLSIGYLAEKIQEYYQKNQPTGIAIEYIIEPQRMGTAGPLIMLKRSGVPFDSDFIVVNGDNLFHFDYAGWLAFHRRSGAVATLALTAVDDVSDKGVVVLAQDRIVDFVEKPNPADAPSNLINSGYYIFSPAIFDYIDANKEYMMLEKDVFPPLAAAGKLAGFVGTGQWFDTGTPKRYEQVKREWQGV